MWPVLESLSIPILLVQVNRGVLNDDQVDEFLASVPGSKKIILESRHNVQPDAPAELAEAIADFSGFNLRNV